VRLLVRIFVIEPELLIFGWIKMLVSIDQRRLCLRMCRDGRDGQCRTEGAEPSEEAAP
jgi:hypothetical protein